MVGGRGTGTGYVGDGVTSEMSDVGGHRARVRRGQDTRAGGQGFQRKSRHERDPEVREYLRQGDDTQARDGVLLHSELHQGFVKTFILEE